MKRAMDVKNKTNSNSHSISSTSVRSLVHIENMFIDKFSEKYRLTERYYIFITLLSNINIEILHSI